MRHGKGGYPACSLLLVGTDGDMPRIRAKSQQCCRSERSYERVLQRDTNVGIRDAREAGGVNAE
jgi:hypothetical protein